MPAQPNREAPPAQPKITPDARKLLDQMKDAYRKLDSAQMNGTLWARTRPSANGTNGTNSQEITFSINSDYQAPNLFRHQLQDDLVIGCTGNKAYILEKTKNVFLQVEVPKGKLRLEDLPPAIPQMLQSQNPSLLFSIIDDPIEGLVRNMSEVTRLPDSEVSGQKFPALGLVPAHDPSHKLTILLDPGTHLVKRFGLGANPAMLKEGAANTNQLSAVSEVTYASVRPGLKFERGHFDWSPPEGAKDLAALQQEGSAAKLEGKPAPQFSLKTLSGKAVSLEDLKGQVVVLDFWATWCPPCVKSLPELGKLHQDAGGKGVQVFAVNVQEDKQKIEGFLKSQEVSVPVLMDQDGDVAMKFNVTAIPQTVVIGKDGEVKKVFVGATPQTYEQIRGEVESAKKEEGP